MYALLYYNQFNTKWETAYVDLNCRIAITSFDKCNPYNCYNHIETLDFLISNLNCEEYYELEFINGYWYIIDTPVVVYPYMVKQMQMNKEYKLNISGV